jgi:hypothetical protein
MTPRCDFTEEGRVIILAGPTGEITIACREIAGVRKRSSKVDATYPCVVVLKGSGLQFYCRDSYERVIEHWLQL